MGDFKWRHYQGQIILNCVRWYCKYGISYGFVAKTYKG